MIQNIYLTEVSHSVAHGRNVLAFSLQRSSVFKSFDPEVCISIHHLLPEAAKQLSWLCC